MDSESFFIQLGLLYRKCRIAQGLKVRTLAAKCKVSADTIRAIEKGKESVKIGSWLTVAKELGLATAWDGLLAEPPRDPFEEFDQQQKVVVEIRKRRVRS